MQAEYFTVYCTCVNCSILLKTCNARNHFIITELNFTFSGGKNVNRWSSETRYIQSKENDNSSHILPVSNFTIIKLYCILAPTQKLCDYIIMSNVTLLGSGCVNYALSWTKHWNQNEGRAHTHVVRIFTTIYHMKLKGQMHIIENTHLYVHMLQNLTIFFVLKP